MEACDAEKVRKNYVDHSKPLSKRFPSKSFKTRDNGYFSGTFQTGKVFYSLMFLVSVVAF